MIGSLSRSVGIFVSGKPFVPQQPMARFAIGVALCAALTAIATMASALVGVPVMLAVLLAGLATRAAVPGFAEWCAPGIGFCAKHVLRLGVSLLGLRIAASDLLSLGGRAVILVLLSVAATAIGGFWIARMLGQPRDIAVVSATSVAICGASAALAASAVLPDREGLRRETAIVIVTVSLLGTLVMIVYPWLAHLIGYDGRASALLLGAAIHDVAQVAGAGFAMSPEIGLQAVTAKMIRVACLLPVVTTFGLMLARDTAEKGRLNLARMVPMFLVTFFVLAIVASAGLVYAPLLALGRKAAGWALTVAVAAIGLKTRFGDLRSAQPRLIASLVGQSLLQFAVVTTLIHLFFGG